MLVDNPEVLEKEHHCKLLQMSLKRAQKISLNSIVESTKENQLRITRRENTITYRIHLYILWTLM